MDSRIQDAPNNVPLKRDHDSVDDFEHLGHDSGSPDDRSEQQHQQQQQPPPRLVDPPRVDDLLHIGDSFQGTDNILPSALLVDGDVNAKPVPATPPPSADFEKCEAMAQSSDPFQRPLDPVDPKLASMAFVETERTYQPAAAHQLHDERGDDEKMHLDKESPPPPPLLPTSIVKAADMDSKVDNEVGFEERADTTTAVADQGKWHEREITPPSSAKAFDEDFVRFVKSSVLPAPEKSPLLDFLGNDEVAPAKLDDVKNIMDDDSWNVVEKTDVKREQPKEPEPPTKPLPPLPKEAELLETAHHDKYETSSDFLLDEAVKPSAPPPPQPRSVNSEPENTKRREAPKPKELDFIYPRSVCKKEEIEIAPKEIFRDIGLGECETTVSCLSLRRPQGRMSRWREEMAKSFGMRSFVFYVFTCSPKVFEPSIVRFRTLKI